MARQDFLFEAILHSEALRLCGSVPRWCERFRILSGAAAHAAYRAQTLQAMVVATRQVVMAGAGLLTVGLGALAMMDGALTMGAQIAVMTLTWRPLAPIHAGFVLLTRLEQLGSVAQIGLQTGLPFPRTDLSHGFRDRDAECGEAVQDGDTDVELGDLTVELAR